MPIRYARRRGSGKRGSSLTMPPAGARPSAGIGWRLGLSAPNGLGGTTAWCRRLQLQTLGGHAAPRLRKKRLEFSRGHGGQANQDGGEAVVVRLGEELGRVE